MKINNEIEVQSIVNSKQRIIKTIYKSLTRLRNFLRKENKYIYKYLKKKLFPSVYFWKILIQKKKFFRTISIKILHDFLNKNCLFEIFFKILNAYIIFVFLSQFTIIRYFLINHEWMKDFILP